MGSFVRRVKTASGATAVQIVHKRGRRVLGIDHVGSTHDESALRVLLASAQEQLRAGQGMLDLALAQGSGEAAAPTVEATGSLILWEALAGVYEQLGFAAIKDDAFAALVLAGSSNPPASWTRSGCWTSSGWPPRRESRSSGA